MLLTLVYSSNYLKLLKIIFRDARVSNWKKAIWECVSNMRFVFTLILIIVIEVMIYNWQDYRIFNITTLPWMSLNDFWYWATTQPCSTSTASIIQQVEQDYWSWQFYERSQNYRTEELAGQSLNEEYKCLQNDQDSAEELHSNDIEVLKECQYSIRYDNVGNTTRKKRVIICGYDNCEKEFIKAWNFLDHFRMHQGVRPFVWNICNKSFTQKGNLK